MKRACDQSTSTSEIPGKVGCSSDLQDDYHNIGFDQGDGQGSSDDIGNLFASENPYNNVVLEIQKRNITINKDYLTMHSPVFKSMFYGAYVEKDKKVIAMKDLEYNKFVELMKIVFLVKQDDIITNDNFEFILEYADRFNFEWIIKKCEQHLLNMTSLSFVSKLSITDKFHLKNLQAQIIKQMNFYDLKEVGTDEKRYEFSFETQFEILDAFMLSNLSSDVRCDGLNAQGPNYRNLPCLGTVRIDISIRWTEPSLCANCIQVQEALIQDANRPQMMGEGPPMNPQFFMNQGQGQIPNDNIVNQQQDQMGNQQAPGPMPQQRIMIPQPGQMQQLPFQGPGAHMMPLRPQGAHPGPMLIPAQGHVNGSGQGPRPGSASMRRGANFHVYMAQNQGQMNQQYQPQ